jgi:hypothetical protein
VRRVLAVAVVALALAGCGRATVSEVQAVRSWMSNAAYTAGDNEIRGDVHNAETALKNATSSAVALHTVCGVLSLDDEAGYNALPTPDAQATSELSTAYNEIGEGATVCFGAAGHASQRQRALLDLETGNADLYFATQRLQIAADQ